MGSNTTAREGFNHGRPDFISEDISIYSVLNNFSTLR